MHSIGSAQSQQYRADTSRADFTSRMTALDWGFDISETSAKLMELGAKAKENGRVMQN